MRNQSVLNGLSWAFVRGCLGVCLSLALPVGLASCSSDSDGTSDQDQIAEPNDDVDVDTEGKYDAASFPSGLYIITDGTSNPKSETVLKLELKADKTFAMETAPGWNCPPPPALCTQPAVASRLDEGTYKFSRSKTNTYVRLMSNGSQLVKFEYKMIGSQLRLRKIGTKVWFDMNRTCQEPSPVGCKDKGCEEGYTCDLSQCGSSACSCDETQGTWICSPDCGGGVCVPTGPSSKCKDPNPVGCKDKGCEEGYTCDLSQCGSSACSCDETRGTWICTPDCGGGVCVPAGTTSKCKDPSPASCKDRACPTGYHCDTSKSGPSVCSCNETWGTWDCTPDVVPGACIAD